MKLHAVGEVRHQQVEPLTSQQITRPRAVARDQLEVVASRFVALELPLVLRVLLADKPRVVLVLDAMDFRLALEVSMQIIERARIDLDPARTQASSQRPEQRGSASSHRIEQSLRPALALEMRGGDVDGQLGDQLVRFAAVLIPEDEILGQRVGSLEVERHQRPCCIRDLEDA